MGLHQRLEESTVGTEAAERRRNIFWILYILEKGICFRCGRPSMFNDDDIAVRLPLAQTNATDSNATISCRLIFGSLAQLAFFESRVYHYIYSEKAKTLPQLERQRRANLLDNELRKWKELLPAAIRPLRKTSPDGYTTRLCMLHLTYYHCLIVLHQSPIAAGPSDRLQGQNQDESQGQTSSNYYYSHSNFICLSAARAMLQLLKSVLFSQSRLEGLLWCGTLSPPVSIRICDVVRLHH